MGESDRTYVTGGNVATGVPMRRARLFFWVAQVLGVVFLTVGEVMLWSGITSYAVWVITAVLLLCGTSILTATLRFWFGPRWGLLLPVAVVVSVFCALPLVR